MVKPFWKVTWQFAIKTLELCDVPFDTAIPIQSFILRRSSYMHAKIQGSILHHVYNSRGRERIHLNVHSDEPQPVVTHFSKSTRRNEGDVWKKRYA